MIMRTCIIEPRPVIVLLALACVQGWIYVGAASVFVDILLLWWKNKERGMHCLGLNQFQTFHLSRPCYSSIPAGSV